jgi:hypothetical protein
MTALLRVVRLIVMRSSGHRGWLGTRPKRGNRGELLD